MTEGDVGQTHGQGRWEARKVKEATTACVSLADVKRAVSEAKPVILVPRETDDAMVRYLNEQEYACDDAGGDESTHSDPFAEDASVRRWVRKLKL